MNKILIFFLLISTTLKTINGNKESETEKKEAETNKIKDDNSEKPNTPVKIKLLTAASENRKYDYYTTIQREDREKYNKAALSATNIFNRRFGIENSLDHLNGPPFGNPNSNQRRHPNPNIPNINGGIYSSSSSGIPPKNGGGEENFYRFERPRSNGQAQNSQFQRYAGIGSAKPVPNNYPNKYNSGGGGGSGGGHLAEGQGIFPSFANSNRRGVEVSKTINVKSPNRRVGGGQPSSSSSDTRGSEPSGNNLFPLNSYGFNDPNQFALTGAGPPYNLGGIGGGGIGQNYNLGGIGQNYNLGGIGGYGGIGGIEQNYHLGGGGDLGLGNPGYISSVGVNPINQINPIQHSLAHGINHQYSGISHGGGYGNLAQLGQLGGLGGGGIGGGYGLQNIGGYGQELGLLNNGIYGNVGNTSPYYQQLLDPYFLAHLPGSLRSIGTRSHLRNRGYAGSGSHSGGLGLFRGINRFENEDREEY